MRGLDGNTLAPYSLSVEIEFDPVTDTTNLATHEISLRAAAVLLSGVHRIEIDQRFAYGEHRLKATGTIAGRIHVCVYTVRADVHRIISLRRANRREVNAYRESDSG